MSRFLLVVPPLAGHLAPLRGVAAELAARGHEIAWAGAGDWLRERTPGPTAGEVHDCDADAFVPGTYARPRVRGAAALKFLVRDYLVPLAERMRPGVEAAIKDFGPDLVLADQQALAGGLAADGLGTPWATSASTTAELTGPYPPAVEQWVLGELAGLGGAGCDPRFSDRLIVAYSTAELARDVDRQVTFVGPVLPPDTGGRPAGPEPGRPLVLVTLGTVNDDVTARFLGACAEALRGRGLRVVIADPAGHLGPQPDDVVVARRVPQLAVLAQASAVICHAGHNTVCEALWHGVPLVVAPIRDDQGVVAGQVVTAGAGLRLRFAHATPARIHDAVDRVLTDPSFLRAAQRIRRSFRSAGGAPAAATHLEAAI